MGRSKACKGAPKRELPDGRDSNVQQKPEKVQELFRRNSLERWREKETLWWRAGVACTVLDL